MRASDAGCGAYTATADTTDGGPHLPLFRSVAALLVAACVCQSAGAQAEAAERQRLIHESWSFKDGAPQVVESLAQAADGYLWLGAESGLYRFDGIRFERFQSPFGDQLPATDVSTLFAPSTGGLWIGYRFGAGFSFLKNGKLTDFKFAFADGEPPRVSLKTLMESCGPPLRVACGDSMALNGSRIHLIGLRN